MRLKKLGESEIANPWVRKHGRGWEGAAPESDARCGVRRGCPCVDAASEFFFFFLGFSPTKLDSHQTRLIQPKLGRIGHIG